MKNMKVMAHIHSLNGEMREITLLEHETLFGRVMEIDEAKNVKSILKKVSALLYV